jgi:hypothetical protein
MRAELDKQVVEGEKIDNYVNQDSGWHVGDEKFTNR